MKHLFLIPLLFLSCTTKTADVKRVDRQTVYAERTFDTIFRLHNNGEGPVRVLAGDSLISETSFTVITNLIPYSGNKVYGTRLVEIKGCIPNGNYLVKRKPVKQSNFFHGFN